MNKANLERLRAEVAAATKAAEAEIKETAEIAVLESQLQMAKDPVIIAAKAKLEAANTTTTALRQLVAQCESIVDSVPVYNTKTRANRQWAGSRRFNYGTQVDLMYQLASGITYACQEHRDLLLAHTGLNQELLEQVLEAFGTPSYYSRNFHEIVEAKAYNAKLAMASLLVMQTELGLVIDVSKVTEGTFKVEFERGELAAKDNLNDANEAIKEANFDL